MLDGHPCPFLITACHKLRGRGHVTRAMVLDARLTLLGRFYGPDSGEYEALFPIPSNEPGREPGLRKATSCK